MSPPNGNFWSISRRETLVPNLTRTEEKLFASAIVSKRFFWIQVVSENVYKKENVLSPQNSNQF